MTNHDASTLRTASRAAAYEYTMLRATTRLLSTPDLAAALGDRMVLDTSGSLYLPSGVKMRQAVQNALVEAFAIHARCLIEFLFYKAHRTYVRATDYFPDDATWERVRPPKSISINDAEEKSSALAAHISVRRVELIEAGDKSWRYGSIYSDLDAAWTAFLTHALRERLDPEVVAGH